MTNWKRTGDWEGQRPGISWEPEPASSPWVQTCHFPLAHSCNRLCQTAAGNVTDTAYKDSPVKPLYSPWKTQLSWKCLEILGSEALRKPIDPGVWFLYSGQRTWGHFWTVENLWQEDTGHGIPVYTGREARVLEMLAESSAHVGLPLSLRAVVWPHFCVCWAWKDCALSLFAHSAMH